MLLSSSSSSRGSTSFSSGLFSVCAIIVTGGVKGQFDLGNLFGGGEDGGGGVMDLIPEEVLAVIPGLCKNDPDSEFTAAIDCAVTNILQCTGLLSVLDLFENIIPTDSANVNNCDDIEASFCPIASQCSRCEDEFDVLARCIVSNTEPGVIDEPIIALLDSCALACNDNGAGDIAIVAADPIASAEMTNDIVVGEGTTSSTSSGPQDIVATAINNGSFTTLVAALSATVDLVPTLSTGVGPFTVFAPTDDAFAALPEKLVPCLLLPENQGALTSILTYHVASGEVLSSDLFNEQTILTVQGEEVAINITTTGDNPTVVNVNDATVIVPDVVATNGVIHAINAVLVPSTIDIGAFLMACPDIVVPVVPVVQPDDNEISDQIGDLLGDIDVDDLGETIGDAVGNVFGDDVGDAVGGAVDTIVESFFGLFSGDSWGFGF